MLFLRCILVLSLSLLFISVFSRTTFIGVGFPSTFRTNCLEFYKDVVKYLERYFDDKKISVDDLCLPIENSNLYLPCGITGRVENE